MGETRKMHYVPECYLQYFAHRRLRQHYVYALPKAGGNLFETNIGNICTERDLYTLPGEDQEQRQILEKMYNDLYEVGYDNIYNILTNPEKEALTPEEHYKVVAFAVSLFFRNHAWHIFHNRVTDTIIEQAYNLTKDREKSSFFFEDQELSIAGKTLEELQKMIREKSRPMIATQTALQIFQLIRLRIMNDHVSVVTASVGFEFITSDNPVTFKPFNIKLRPVPMDPTNSLWVPIDSQHLLTLHPWADQLEGQTLGRMKDGPFPGIQSSMSNHFQWQQSDRFLLGTEAGLEKFQTRPSGIFPPEKMG
jgi:hypothetical protein